MAGGHCRACRGVTHPRRNLPGDAGANFKVKDFLAATAGPLIEPQAFAMQRMPAVFDDNKLRTVC